MDKIQFLCEFFLIWWRWGPVFATGIHGLISLLAVHIDSELESNLHWWFIRPLFCCNCVALGLSYAIIMLWLNPGDSAPYFNCFPWMMLLKAAFIMWSSCAKIYGGTLKLPSQPILNWWTKFTKRSSRVAITDNLKKLEHLQIHTGLMAHNPVLSCFQCLITLSLAPWPSSRARHCGMEDGGIKVQGVPSQHKKLTLLPLRGTLCVASSMLWPCSLYGVGCQSLFPLEHIPYLICWYYEGLDFPMAATGSLNEAECMTCSKSSFPQTSLWDGCHMNP